MSRMPAFQNPSQQKTNGESSCAFLSPPATHWPQFDPPLRLGVMASGRGSNLEALVHACRDGRVDGKVDLLVVNKADCGARTRAERLGLQSLVLDHREYPTREALDHALVACFRGAGVEAIVMAGWMRIVTDVLINAFPRRLINLHPSLLPSFRGVDAIGQALEAGVKITGCSAHWVAPEVDSGPVIAQAAVPIFPTDDKDSLAERIRREEHRLLPWAVALAAQQWRAQG